MFKTRHFPNYKINCRVVLRGTRVTLSIWAMGGGGWAATELKCQAFRAYLHSAQPARKMDWGCLVRQGIGDTLRVCNKRLGGRGGGRTGLRTDHSGALS